MELTTKITDNFTIGEMVMTSHRELLEENQNPPQNVIDNLNLLCKNILQPLRDKLGYSIHVNSGYRCPELNKTVGGAANSQHMTGQAADIIDFTNGNLHLFDFIKDSGLPFDQLITECPDKNGVPAWVHVSFDAKRNRKEVLKATKVGENPNGSPIFSYQKL